MVVSPDMVRKKEAKPEESKAKLKYCKSCECKHKKGEHTYEGKRKYAAKQSAERRKHDEERKAQDVRVVAKRFGWRISIATPIYL